MMISESSPRSWTRWNLPFPDSGNCPPNVGFQGQNSLAVCEGGVHHARGLKCSQRTMGKPASSPAFWMAKSERLVRFSLRILQSDFTSLRINVGEKTVYSATSFTLYFLSLRSMFSIPYASFINNLYPFPVAPISSSAQECTAASLFTSQCISIFIDST